MNSRERMRAAFHREDVDYVPCCCNFSPSLVGPSYTWEGRADSIERIVNELGLDYCVDVGVSASWHPDVTTRVGRDHPAGARWPVLHKEIVTPAGSLTAAVYLTDDWPHGDDIPLNSDWNVSRFVKPWLRTEEDVECYQYVHLPPSDDAIRQARTHYAEQKKLADQYGVMTRAGCGMGLTSALQLFGPEQAVVISIEQPELLERFLAIEHAATMCCAEVLADLQVDLIVRNGFYETMDFWSPRQYETLLMPLLREEIDAMHAGGAVVSYTVCTGIMPMLDHLAELDFESYNCIEPALTGQDMHEVARKLCNRHAIWGGVSGPIHIGEGTPEIARQAVRDAFELFGPRGLILSAVPSIRAHWPWENALAMFDEWRTLRTAGL